MAKKILSKEDVFRFAEDRLKTNALVYSRLEVSVADYIFEIAACGYVNGCSPSTTSSQIICTLEYLDKLSIGYDANKIRKTIEESDPYSSGNIFKSVRKEVEEKKKFSFIYKANQSEEERNVKAATLILEYTLMIYDYLDSINQN